VNSEGFNNRYRSRDRFAPHCDLAFARIYPGKDNSDYTADENRNNRRYNRNLDRYEMARKGDGYSVDDETEETAVN